MNYKYFLILSFFTFIGCSTYTVTNNEINVLNKSNFKNKGFTLVYNDDLYKQKIISKKLTIEA